MSSRPQIPRPDDPAPPGRDDPRRTRQERAGRNRCAVVEPRDLRAPGYRPYHDASVLSRREQPAAVVGERHTRRGPVEPSAHKGPAVRRADGDGPVGPRFGDERTVRGCRDVPDRARAHRDGPELRIRAERPRSRGAVGARGQRPGTVGTECDRGDAPTMPEELRLRRTGGGVPDPSRAVATRRQDLPAVGTEDDRVDEAGVAHELDKSRPDSASHTRAVPSVLAVAILSPVAEYAEARTLPVCPTSWMTGFPESASHSCGTSSSPVVRILRPSGETTALVGVSIWSSRACRASPTRRRRPGRSDRWKG